jgi:hypothetical protein
MSSSGVLDALYCVAPLFLQRGATSEVGEEAGPPCPRGVIEASANTMVKEVSTCVCSLSSLSAARALPPPFIGQGEAAYKCAALF